MHVLDQKDLSKRALTDHFHNYEVLQLHRQLIFFVSAEYHVAASTHALAGRWLFIGTAFLILIFLIIIVLILVLEVLALLELLVSNFHVLLIIVKAEGAIYDVGRAAESHATGNSPLSLAFALGK